MKICFFNFMLNLSVEQGSGMKTGFAGFHAGNNRSITDYLPAQGGSLTASGESESAPAVMLRRMSFRWIRAGLQTGAGFG